MSFYSEHIFPWMLERWGNCPEKPMDMLRKKTFEGISGKVLDVGFGIGFNMKLYPKEVTEIVALDPSDGVTKRAKKHIGSSLTPIKFLKEFAESMPFIDAEFDAVVSTFTLCTVSDLMKSLKEIKRVLKPEGIFYFIEHVAASSRKHRKMQDFFNPLNRALFCGCNLNRETERAIIEIGFKLEDIERFTPSDVVRDMPEAKGWPKFMLYMIRGVAVHSA